MVLFWGKPEALQAGFTKCIYIEYKTNFKSTPIAAFSLSISAGRNPFSARDVSLM
jgi:hypothetical protein